MSYAKNLLASYGFTLTQAQSFILANISNPTLVYDTLGKYGISFEMIAEIFGGESTPEKVKDYFLRGGLDVSGEGPNVEILAIEVVNSIGETLSQNDVNLHLSTYDLTYLQAQNFIYSYIHDPQYMYDTLGGYGVSFAMIAVLYGQGFTEEKVKSYFQAHGLDVSSDSPSSLAFVPPNIDESLAALSHKYATVSSVADAQTLYVDAVMSTSTWGGSNVSFSFPQAIPSEHLIQGDTSDGWRLLNQEEQSTFTEAVEYQNKIIDVDLAFSLGDGDIRVVAINQSSAEAFAYFPGDGIGGDIFLNASGSDDAQYYSTGGYGISTIVHELGHAMGLEHSFEGIALSAEYENSYYSIMSYTNLGHYRVQVEATDVNIRVYTQDAYRAEFGIVDVAALQVMYGPDMEANLGDTVYVYTESTRSFEGASGYYHTIWDAGGVDTLDLSNAQYSSTVNLNDYTLSSVSERSAEQEAISIASAADLYGASDIQFVQDFIEDLGSEAFLNTNNLGIAYGTVIENVITGYGNDTVTDNEVDNQIYLGAGNDIVNLGAGGNDYIDGGEGMDTVKLSIHSDDVQVYLNSDVYYLVSSSFGATLVGIEVVEFSDTTLALA